MSQSATGFQVIRKGFFSLVQDAGRFGYEHLGVTNGGPMDAMAASWANRLLDNSADASLIEVTAGGLELEVRTQTMIAVTGGDLNLTVNGKPQAPWRSFWVSTGDRLRFGTPRLGFRAYLGVQGGFQVPEVLGSMATVKRDKLGGVCGRGEALQDGDFLASGILPEEGIARQIPERFMPDYSGPLTLHIIPGYQQHAFSKSTWQQLMQQPFELDTRSDRMGARLSGSPLQSPTLGMYSEPLSYAAVQVPADGQPIIMLNDRQTLGGYPKLGNILPLDCFALAQRQPGTRIRFAPIGLMTAQQQMRRYLRFFGL
ncbi:allophanate hydrolase [Aliidiomarina sedimenti]|uniref:Allophanate hydrolase n=1 Tax=Aliidiomarina sedimenti TaxID=1933879 RepID=A0ABY0C131_9GAMM|nr:biotin-dependent carboxyltransferase family protein [Aliidiomarina sedimenti]RUO31507.1 allophanate hydrolase [Aliidiomarina sedimenti]